MQLEDYTHWITGLSAAVTGLGAWLWRLARLDQQREDRLARLEQWRQEHMREYRAVAETLAALQQGQAVQVVELRNICRSLDELRKDHRKFIAGRIVGGRRRDDPASEEDDA